MPRLSLASLRVRLLLPVLLAVLPALGLAVFSFEGSAIRRPSRSMRARFGSRAMPPPIKSNCFQVRPETRDFAIGKDSGM